MKPESVQLWQNERVAELYTALVRGRLLLGDVVCIRRNLVRPTEGSKLWRLAGRRTQGREAVTLVRGLLHGVYGGEPCTLVELRPVTSSVQQLRLHCVAMGHPIVGDAGHDADRLLDFKFNGALNAPRLMLHCSYQRVPFASGLAEAISPDPLANFLDLAGAADDVSSSNLDVARTSPLLDVTVASGSTRIQSMGGPWESFAGGIPKGVLDETHWDVPEHVRRIRSRPWGPPEWDPRAASDLARAEKFATKKGRAHRDLALGRVTEETATGMST